MEMRGWGQSCLTRAAPKKNYSLRHTHTPTAAQSRPSCQKYFLLPGMRSGRGGREEREERRREGGIATCSHTKAGRGWKRIESNNGRSC